MHQVNSDLLNFEENLLGAGLVLLLGLMANRSDNQVIEEKDIMKARKPDRSKLIAVKKPRIMPFGVQFATYYIRPEEAKTPKRLEQTAVVSAINSYLYKIHDRLEAKADYYRKRQEIFKTPEAKSLAEAILAQWDKGEFRLKGLDEALRAIGLRATRSPIVAPISQDVNLFLSIAAVAGLPQKEFHDYVNQLDKNLDLQYQAITMDANLYDELDEKALIAVAEKRQQAKNMAVALGLVAADPETEKLFLSKLEIIKHAYKARSTILKLTAQKLVLGFAPDGDEETIDRIRAWRQVERGLNTVRERKEYFETIKTLLAGAVLRDLEKSDPNRIKKLTERELNEMIAQKWDALKAGFVEKGWVSAKAADMSLNDYAEWLNKREKELLGRKVKVISRFYSQILDKATQRAGLTKEERKAYDDAVLKPIQDFVTLHDHEVSLKRKIAGLARFGKDTSEVERQLQKVRALKDAYCDYANTVAHSALLATILSVSAQSKEPIVGFVQSAQKISKGFSEAVQAVTKDEALDIAAWQRKILAGIEETLKPTDRQYFAYLKQLITKYPKASHDAVRFVADVKFEGVRQQMTAKGLGLLRKAIKEAVLGRHEKVSAKINWEERLMHSVASSVLTFANFVMGAR